jgi:hypothetical protein
MCAFAFAASAMMSWPVWPIFLMVAVSMGLLGTSYGQPFTLVFVAAYLVMYLFVVAGLFLASRTYLARRRQKKKSA